MSGLARLKSESRINVFDCVHVLCVFSQKERERLSKLVVIGLVTRCKGSEAAGDLNFSRFATFCII